MTYSQIGQDLEVIKFYNNKKEGFFIEIGASDGIELSNTYLLETKYNWKGICCEPIPSNFEKLVKNRKNSICFSEAVYNQSGLTLSFDIANNFNLLSGISDHIDCHLSFVNSRADFRYWIKDVADKDKTTGSNLYFPTIKSINSSSLPSSLPSLPPPLVYLSERIEFILSLRVVLELTTLASLSLFLFPDIVFFNYYKDFSLN